MRKSIRKVLAQQETRLVKRLRACRDKVDHLETVVDGLRLELEQEREERVRQIDFATQILGPLVADLEHRAEQPGADSETRADYKEIVEHTEAEEDRLVAFSPEELVRSFGEGCS